MSKNNKTLRKEALLYHSEPRPGKIEVVPTKPHFTQYDLSLAYSPGVAEPCLEIEKDPAQAYRYTSKGNLVAVISNGTAVLGLGNIGPLAGKPVMEGKALLFKIFADIDVFDIEVSTENSEEFIETVRNISVTFGGINLEDIKAPECFEIEKRLRDELDIPVMHDDQHGTAIIASAALMNALEITGRDMSSVKVVINGAGAAAISTARLFTTMGVSKNNLIMCDSKGAINFSRTDLNEAKKEFATSLDVSTLAEAITEADVFVGLSVADILTPDMVRTMAKDPIVMALANPDPEISYEKAMSSRSDIIFATGRSDLPNQVNNVLGFPYIFRGALDIRATKINEQMKLAAAYALASLAKEPVPDSVSMAYNNSRISFGREYLIPKPLDPRLISTIPIAVAKAAIESGVATHAIDDWDAYKTELERRSGQDNQLLKQIRTMVALAVQKTIVFSNGENPNVIKAAASLIADKLIKPILIGSIDKIHQRAVENNIDPALFVIIDPLEDHGNKYADMIYSKLNRKGVSMAIAQKYVRQNEWLALAVVSAGEADSAIIDYANRYGEAIAPAKALFCEPSETLAAMYIVSTKKGLVFFSDVSVNTDPSTPEIVEIVKLTASAVRSFGVEPVIALLSHSNFGADYSPEAGKMADAAAILHDMHPDIVVDGDIKADIALNTEARDADFPFTKLYGNDVNTFIFPNLSAANITSKMLHHFAGADLMGPILLGIGGKAYYINQTSDARSIRNLAVIAAAFSANKKHR